MQDVSELSVVWRPFTALLPVRLDIRCIRVRRRKACRFGFHELYKVIFD